jgi:hypothetical protein|tara:strand:- start:902 stop:1072 length:171 start_codon:yes stop_codon:yes gene_type:complete
LEFVARAKKPSANSQGDAELNIRAMAAEGVGYWAGESYCFGLAKIAAACPHLSTGT